MIALNLACSENKMYKTSDDLSRDMLDFDILENGLGIVSPPHFASDLCIKKKCLPCYIVLTDQISLFGCPYFLRYWAICLSQLFVPSLKLTLSF